VAWRAHGLLLIRSLLIFELSAAKTLRGETWRRGIISKYSARRGVGSQKRLGDAVAGICVVACSIRPK
jgi:hypothetical protein